MSSQSFVAKWGGRVCPRCNRVIRKGQTVYFGGTNTLYHAYPCPPEDRFGGVLGPNGERIQTVFFHYLDCGCRAGRCVHEGA